MKTQKMMLISSGIICIVLLFVVAPSFGGGKKMEPLYDLNKTITFKPQEYKTRSSMTLSLFPLPRDNAVGTNDMGNSITVLSFNKDRIKFDEYFKNALSDIGGGGLFSPPLSQDTIAFGQKRYFMFFNFRTKKAEEYIISGSIDKYIEKVFIANARQRHFLFEIQEFNRHSEDPEDYTTFIQLTDLSGKEPKLIKKIKKERGVGWFVAQDRFFMFKRDKIQVFTTGLEPAYHPLADVFKRNAGKIDAWRIHMHPTLPFAIVVDRSSKTFIISWGQGGNDQLVAVSNGETQDFTFSPDGKWVVFKDDSPDPANTHLMPVSEKYPNYLGSPIKLFDSYFNQSNNAWTNNPVSFVGAKLDEIYRWELTTAAHPESTKPDFHEYILEKDLEKLTKEKKQGLGNGKK